MILDEEEYAPSDEDEIVVLKYKRAVAKGKLTEAASASSKGKTPISAGQTSSATPIPTNSKGKEKEVAADTRTPREKREQFRRALDGEAEFYDTYEDVAIHINAYTAVNVVRVVGAINNLAKNQEELLREDLKVRREGLEIRRAELERQSETQNEMSQSLSSLPTLFFGCTTT